MRAVLATSVLMVLLAAGEAKACPIPASKAPPSDAADLQRSGAKLNLQRAAVSAIEHAQSTEARVLPRVREPAALFTVPRALRLYGMFVFVVGLLLTQALVAPWLLGARTGKPRAGKK